jgi:3-phenylpropionate/trans-cinnamate dioxygenase ferredoxin subunit
MEDWIELPEFLPPPPGRGRALFVGGRDIALFCIDGTWLAVEDSCPHQGASLGQGLVDGCVVKCPAHGMKFDLRTGKMPGVPAFGVKAYAVKEIDGKLKISWDEVP